MLYEIHYSIDGCKRWWRVTANSKAEARGKLFAKYDGMYVLIDWIEEL